VVGCYFPAQLADWLIPGRNLFLAIHVLGVASFAYIVARRLVPLLRAERDPRFDRPLARLAKVGKFWLGQWKHPRYKTAGVLHIVIFAGFILLATRAFTVLIVGVSQNFVMPGLSGEAGHVFTIITDYAATIVSLCMIVAVIRRLVFRPARYEVPARFGKAHKVDAVFLLALIAILMVADSLFAAAKAGAQSQLGQPVESLAVLSLPWILQIVFTSSSLLTLRDLYFGAYLLHEVTFYFLLCYRPFGIQFHVETSLFTVFRKTGSRDASSQCVGRSDEQLIK
jgi:hypothetical protein